MEGINGSALRKTRQMKKTASLKSLKSRDKNNKVVRRRDGKGKMRLYVINKEKSSHEGEAVTASPVTEPPKHK